MDRPKRNDVAKVAEISAAIVSYLINNGPQPWRRKRVPEYRRQDPNGWLPGPQSVSAFMSYRVDAVEENPRAAGMACFSPVAARTRLTRSKC